MKYKLNDLDEDLMKEIALRADKIRPHESRRNDSRPYTLSELDPGNEDQLIKLSKIFEALKGPNKEN